MDTITKLPVKTRRKPVRKSVVKKEQIVSTPETLPETPVKSIPLPVMAASQPVSVAKKYKGLKAPVGTAGAIKYKAADGWKITIFGQQHTDDAWHSGYVPAIDGCIEVLDQSHYNRVKIKVEGEELTVLADGNDVLWLSKTGDWEQGVLERSEKIAAAFKRETEDYTKKNSKDKEN